MATVPSRTVQSEWPLGATPWDRSARPLGHLLWPALHDPVVNAPPGIRRVHNATAMKRTLHLELSLFCACRIEFTPVSRAIIIRVVAHQPEAQTSIVILIDHPLYPIERGRVRSGDHRCHGIISPGQIALYIFTYQPFFKRACKVIAVQISGLTAGRSGERRPVRG